jgi:hypothetical protein
VDQMESKYTHREARKDIERLAQSLGLRCFSRFPSFRIL